MKNMKVYSDNLDLTISSDDEYVYVKNEHFSLTLVNEPFAIQFFDNGDEKTLGIAANNILMQVPA